MHRELEPKEPARVLIVSYSFSNQTRKIVRALKEGLSGREQVRIRHIRLEPEPAIDFPLSSIARTVSMMFRTLFRLRTPIRPIPNRSGFDYDLLILAGPTWSYNPSGPILSFLDRYASDYFYHKPVLPVISCRGYWRAHWLYLRSRIKRAGGHPLGPWVFTHPAPEPWRTIGVFLTVAGLHPRQFAFMKGRYRRYGHSRRQIEAARDMAARLKEGLLKGEGPSAMEQGVASKIVV